jgi:hypothetical protein
MTITTPQSWKTTGTGILVILLTAAGPVLDHYHPLVGLSWTTLMTSIAAAVGGLGLIAAKDADVHSTTAQVAASQAAVTAQTPEQIVAAAAEAKVADAQVAAKK